MENQINTNEQNNQPMSFPEKPKVNYWTIGITIFVCFIFLGLSGYYLRKQPSQSQQVTNVPNKSKIVPRTTLEPISSWKTYVNNNLGFIFNYPQDYNVSEIGDGLFVIRAPGDNLMQGGGIRIDAEPQWINKTTFEEAEKWINSTLLISKTSKLGNWSIFVGIAKGGIPEGIEFKEAVTNYKNGVIKLEIMTSGPYDDIFEEVVKSFKFTN